MNEAEMLKGCKAQKEKAQKQLFDKYVKLMLGVCMRYADSYEEAQDIVQVGFVKVFKKINSFSGKGSLEGWIRRIVVNTALDHLRKYKNHRFNLNVDDVDFLLKEDQKAEGKLREDDLMGLIQTLPIGYKTVFNLYAIEGYTHKEIGEKLSISENTSKSQYSRARSILKKKLEELDIHLD